MKLIDVVKAALSDDDLLVRAWSHEVHNDPASLVAISRPDGLSAQEMSVAASLLETACTLLGQDPPSWVHGIQAAPVAVFLPSRMARMPRTRRLVLEHSPEAMKKRNVFADPEYLSIV